MLRDGQIPWGQIAPIILVPFVLNSSSIKNLVSLQNAIFSSWWLHTITFLVDFFCVCVCLIWIIPKFPTFIPTKQKGCFQPKKPQIRWFVFGFLSPKPTEAELIFRNWPNSGFFRAKRSLAARRGCRAVAALCHLLCLFWVTLGKTGLFFFSLLWMSLVCWQGEGPWPPRHWIPSVFNHFLP